MFTMGGAALANVRFTTGVILPHLEILCGPAFYSTRVDKFLRVRIFNYACGYLNMIAQIFSRVQILI